MRNKKKQYPTINGKKCASDFEFQVFKGLRNLIPPKALIEYETERLPYVIDHEYVPDFVITLPDERKIYIEAKGNGYQFDYDVQRKLIAVKEQHPELDLRLVFYSDGKIGRKRKNGTFRRQSDWAKENGFEFSIREIPQEWFR